MPVLRWRRAGYVAAARGVVLVGLISWPAEKRVCRLVRGSRGEAVEVEAPVVAGDAGEAGQANTAKVCSECSLVGFLLTPARVWHQHGLVAEMADACGLHSSECDAGMVPAIKESVIDVPVLKCSH